MEKVGNPRSVSDHNTNAQVAPVRDKAVDYGDNFQDPVTAGRPPLDSCHRQMPGIVDKATAETSNSASDGTETENFYRYRDQSEDRSGENGGDGRRSCCSLSDDTSSMSETELSESDRGHQEYEYHSSGSGEGDSRLVEEADAQCKYNKADDTYTDLTVESFDLSAVDSCYLEGECSDVPEISAIEITDTEFSYGDQEWANSEQSNSPAKSDKDRLSPVGAESVNVKEQSKESQPHLETDPANETPAHEQRQETGKSFIEHSTPESEVSEQLGGCEALPCDWQDSQTASYDPIAMLCGFPPPCQFQPPYVPCPPFLPPTAPCCSPWATGACQDALTCPPFPGQVFPGQYPPMAMPLYQPWLPPPQMFPCCAQFPSAHPLSYQDPSILHSSVGQFPPPGDVCQAEGIPLNTDGVLTADQYYSGEQTAEVFDPAIPQPTEPPAPEQIGVSGPDQPNFQYPCVYVSQAGLITVLLKHDVSVELTVDRTLRIVSHQRQLVIASNSRGSANCLYHPQAKVCHDGTTTEVELSDSRRVKMCTEEILVAKGDKSYRFDYKDLQEAAADFRDITRDNSVTLLFGSSGYGPALIPRCLELAQSAQYKHSDDGSFRVRIHDISIAQNSRGDVTVLCGPKFLKMAPLSSYLRLQTHFIDMAVYPNGKVFVRRGTHSLDSNPTSLHVNNGNLEVGLDDGEDVKVVRLPRRAPMNNTLSRRQRRSQPPNTRQSKSSWRRQ